MHEYRHTARVYERGNFNLEGAVKAVLERHDSNKMLCLHELSQCSAYVQERLKATVQRNYPKFIESANQVESAAQSLLKVREHITTLKGTVQQIADAQLCEGGGEAAEADAALPGDADATYAALAADKSAGTPEEQRLREIKESIDLAIYEYDFEKAASIVLAALDAANHDTNTVSRSYQRALWDAQEVVASNIFTALTNTPALSSTLLKLLLRLGRVQRAYKFFFTHRSEWVRSEVRRVRFVGDMPEYAKSAATAVFRGLAATYVEFAELSKASGCRAGSTAVRWLATEIYDFSFLLKSQIFSVEVAADVFRALSEVFKACRDHLEPLSLDLLPHLRHTLEESALDMLERECLFMQQSCDRELRDDDFSRKPGDEFEEIHAPPLWTRAARNERLNVVLSRSTQHLLLSVCTLLGNVRVACLHPPDGAVSSRGADRPWTVLEEPTDRIIAETVRHYISEVFDRPAAGMAPSQLLTVLSNVRFLVHNFLKRLSAVMCETFYRKRITNIDELIDKSAGVPDRLQTSLAEQWAAGIVEAAGAGSVDNNALILAVTADALHGVACVRREALSVFADREVADCTTGAFAEHVLLAAVEVLGTAPRDVAVFNAVLLRRGLAGVVGDAALATLTQAVEPTAAEERAAGSAIDALDDPDICGLVQELTCDTDAAGPAAADT